MKSTRARKDWNVRNQFFRKNLKNAVNRKCITCNSNFLADGKFNKICENCKKTDNYIYNINEVSLNE